MHRMQYYSLIKRNELLIHPTWTYLKCILLGKSIWTQKVTDCMIPFVYLTCHRKEERKKEREKNYKKRKKLQNGKQLPGIDSVGKVTVKRTNMGTLRMMALLYMLLRSWTHDCIHLSRPKRLCITKSEF